MRHIKFILCCGFVFFSSNCLQAQLFQRNHNSLAEIVGFQLRQQKEWNQQQQPSNSILKNLVSPVIEFQVKQPSVHFNFTGITYTPENNLQVPVLYNKEGDNQFKQNIEVSRYKKWLKNKRLREQAQSPGIFIDKL